MVQSTAATVDDYLAEAPAERRDVLERIRDLCVELLPEFTERMAWGMPAYFRGEAAPIAFASQKQYIVVYVMDAEIREEFAERLAGQDMGKSCLRFRKPEQVDLDLVADLIRASAR